jgi:hypothetical protein
VLQAAAGVAGALVYAAEEMGSGPCLNKRIKTCNYSTNAKQKKYRWQRITPATL